MAISKLLLLAQCVFLIAMCLAIASYRFQWLAFRPAFGAFALMLLLLALTGLLALVGVLLTCFGKVQLDCASGSLAIALGVLPFLFIVIMVGKGLRVPAIHDISTDTANPIEFRHAGSLRKPDENRLAFPAPEVLSQQQAFYRDLKPLLVAAEPGDAFVRSKALVETLGWQIVWQDESAWMFEAIAKTALFGFVDDVALRVSEQEGLTKIDLRSVSRVGRSDLGANAKRIQAFQALYQREYPEAY